MSDIKYVMGLDIGIGSVGWAVIRVEGMPRIENFGVRIFESGENSKKKSRASQERRGFRGARRLTRRRAHRRARIRFWFQKQGLVTEAALRKFFAEGTKNLVSLRVRGLDEKLTPEEIAACMIHIANHRGYLAFYDEPMQSEGEAGKKKKDGKEKDAADNAAGVQAVRDLLQAGGYRSVAEMILKDAAFAADHSAYRRYRNRAGYTTRYVMPREEVQREARKILEVQSAYYPAMTAEFIDKIMDILFSQRDFEDGPGNAEDAARPYKGFLDNEGACRFYRDEKRGHRFTYLADAYALVNILSQYRYFDAKSGELTFTPELAQALFARAVAQGGMCVNDVKEVAKAYGLKVVAGKTEKRDTITQAMRYLKAVKPIFVDAGFDWEQLTAEDMTDMQTCLLNRVGETLSRNVTPRRRRARLKEIGRLTECAAGTELIERLTRLRLSGTANVSNKFMEGAVSAFLEGEPYGVYQAKFNDRQEAEQPPKEKYYKLPPYRTDFAFCKNPVVMRSLSEARKAINRVIEEYGSPYAINVEVGSDLSKSFQARSEIENEQKQNEKRRLAAQKTIATLLSIKEEEVSAAMIERYFLGEQQNWQCLYSGRAIDQATAVKNADKTFEVDHIVPFSLVLDNTLHNKALVYHAENQKKGQRVPLEYLHGEAETNFRGRVNTLYRNKKISEKKYNYLLVKSVYDSDLMGVWKSRNLNDMRYITKVLVGYLKENLRFRPADEGDMYRPEVYAVKGAITSLMRRTWLNPKTWGVYDKSVLKEQTYLDHAADAIVLACCLPAFVEMTAVHQRLNQILKNNGGYPNEEYDAVLADAKHNIGRIYHISDARLEEYLTRRNARPSLIRNLRQEVDIRLQDVDMMNYFEKERAKREGGKPVVYEAGTAADKFRKDVLLFYKDDPAFAQSLRMPFTVHIASRKANGKVTDGNAVRIAETIEGTKELSRKLVYDLKPADLNNLYTHDEDLRQSLTELLAGCAKDDTLGKVLGVRGETEFRTKGGVYVRRVTLKSAAKRTLRKQIDENNFSLLPDTSYYCVEIYKNTKGKTCATGIAFSDIVIRNGRVWLKESYCPPQDYAEHCLYLFKNDYIRITNKKGLKFEGYYRSVYNINQSSFYYVRYNTPMRQGKCFSLAGMDTVEKFDVDPIGRIGGKIRCGEPLLSVRASGSR